jgi:hypothetical protein
MSETKVYVAHISFVGVAESVEDFIATLWGALAGDSDARQAVRVGSPHITIIDKELFGGEEPK